MPTIDTGLEGVVVGSTAISHVEGELGRLSYRGYDIADLAERSFLQVVWLLLFDAIPSAQQEQQLAQFLAAHRSLSDNEQALLAAIPTGTHPMLMLQGMVPLLELQPRETMTLPTTSADALEGLIIAARLPLLIASYYRREQGLSWPLNSHASEPHRAFLQALHGDNPTALQVEALDTAQILQMEHSYNAGTFAGRVALSTQAPIASSISASLGTLFGKLHGGADQAALEAALAAGNPQQAATYVRECLAKGERIMGMGHREYRTVDPRAGLLKPLARRLCAGTDSANVLATLEAIEAACVEQLEKPGRPIRANVEFYKGAVFSALGIPPRYFTALFAMGRVYGYIAHALEFRPEARLIRPRAHYEGRLPNNDQAA
ncbi:citrate/2-methylcitrate synthase [Halieaceae bacterium IMCC14734]|uniref:Citrate synthase n=1 Tax=Candidatus Litorirhabdus singularis TaxID=2518993 RepID=A0ABT3TD17_9GAMM|nr:citrate/2-methylcitrate synthase [Candidatus Litorirhabdus singularis]MCX2979367.1 citrate/2-methylcitrate synthase [Candidatus Litorirhabdus singularis]